MLKKIGTIIVSFVLVLALVTGCSSGNNAPAAAGKTAKWPERKIDLVIPFGPGSGQDTTFRALAPLLEKQLGVTVVVSNMEGAGALKGMEYVAGQPADGYTFMTLSPSHILGSVQKLTKTDIMTDFTPVSRVVQDSVLIDGSPKGRFKSWAELQAWAKEHPGDVKIGGLTPKGIDALAIRMVGKAAGIEMTFVPFGGGAEVKSAMLGGHIDVSNDDPVNAIELVKSGDIIPLLVVNSKRLPAFPDTPCTVELGLDVVAGPWRGIAVKKGSPEEAVKGMEAAIAKAIETPEWKEFLKKSMLDQRPGYANSAEFAKIWEQEHKYYTDAFSALGLQ